MNRQGHRQLHGNDIEHTSNIRDNPLHIRTNYLLYRSVFQGAKMSTNVKKVAIYCRVSTDQQDKDDGGSLPTQEKRCRDWCEFENGRGAEVYEVIDVYKDVASGSDMDRPELKRLFDDAETNKINLILVTKVDRFSRSILNFLETNENLIKWNVEFFPVDQAIFGTKGPEGNLMRNILLAFAEFEREMTKKRTLEGMRAKLARGEWRGGYAPFGYDPVNKSLVINHDEAEIVKLIFAEYLNDKSSKDIADILNNKGITNKLGNKWLRKSVLGILHNPVYIGKFYVPGKKPEMMPGKHAPMINEPIFNEVQSIADTNQVRRYISRDLPNDFLFSSLLKCGHCGSAISGYKKPKGKKIYSYYRCQKAIRETADSCKMGQINSVDIEATGVSLLRMLSIDNRLLDSVLKHASMDKDAELEAVKENKQRIQSRKTGNESRLNELLRVLEKPEAEKSKEVILVRINELKDLIEKDTNQIDAFIVLLDRLRQPITDKKLLWDKYHSFWRMWKDLDTVGRKKAIRSIVKEIRIVKLDNNRYKLEFDLLNDVKTKTFANEDEGSVVSVQTNDTFGSGGRI